MRINHHLSLAVITVLAANVHGAPTLPITTAATFSDSAHPSTSTSVLLMPFRGIGEVGKDAWISEAIDEGLTNDLSHNANIRLLHSPATMPSTDGLSAAGLKAARLQNAQRLVLGSFQVIDDQIRISGQVIDSADGKTVGQLKVTGTKHDLFNLEDSLAAELEHALPNLNQPDTSFTVTPVPSQGVDQQQQWVDDGAGQSNPGVVYSPNLNSGYSSGYDGYPEYGYYGYPFYGTGLFFTVGRGHFHHGHDGFNEGGGRYRQTGGGPIIPTPTAPVRTFPTFPNGGIRNPGPASLTPSHGFVGPVGPGGIQNGAVQNGAAQSGGGMRGGGMSSGGAHR